MIQTVIFNNKNFSIPSNAIMEKLLNLNEALEGQSIKIKSIFNKQDNTPSMIIFYAEEENIYRFKDFSSGAYGDAADIAMHIYGLADRQTAFRKILEIFKDNLDVVRTNYIAVKETKEVSSYKIRKWNNADAEYWKSYGIGGSFLKQYNIKPLESFTIKITRLDVVNTMDFANHMCYGYFTKEGTLYKIYQPTRTRAKFMKLNECTQGEEQLTYNKKCLIIAASLKDIGAFKALKYPNIDLIAPDSENVTITQQQIDKYQEHYEIIFTMFDNDIAGMTAMKKYKKLYNIPYIYFNVEKDIAECVKQHGIANTKVFFTPIFKDALKRNTQNS